MTDPRRYERETPTVAQSLLIESILPGSSVLELGASYGHMSRWLRDRGCQVIAAEFDRSALDDLTARADEAHWIDLENLETASWLNGRRFDYIVLADVLEHLRNPDEVLSWSHDVLAPGGRLLVSMPNVAFWRVRYQLFRGDWPATDTGILDRTHVRFYTQDTAERLFSASGWKVEKVRSADDEYPFDKRIYGAVRLRSPRIDELKARLNLELLRRSPRLFTYQYVWVLSQGQALD